MFTPQETYLIQFSEISQTHTAANHFCSEETILRCLRQLIDLHCHNTSSNSSHGTSKKSLEMFVFLKKSKHIATNYNDQIENFNDIIKNCKKKCVINFSNKTIVENLNCCSELRVFEDIKRLNISNNPEIISNDLKVSANEEIYNWYKTDISVRRYDCKTINGKQVWEYVS